VPDTFRQALATHAGELPARDRSPRGGRCGPDPRRALGRGANLAVVAPCGGGAGAPVGVAARGRGSRREGWLRLRGACRAPCRPWTRRRGAPSFVCAYELLSADPWLADADPARLERLRALGADSSS